MPLTRVAVHAAHHKFAFEGGLPPFPRRESDSSYQEKLRLATARLAPEVHAWLERGWCLGGGALLDATRCAPYSIPLEAWHNRSSPLLLGVLASHMQFEKSDWSFDPRWMSEVKSFYSRRWATICRILRAKCGESPPDFAARALQVVCVAIDPASCVPHDELEQHAVPPQPAPCTGSVEASSRSSSRMPASGDVVSMPVAKHAAGNASRAVARGVHGIHRAVPAAHTATTMVTEEAGRNRAVVGLKAAAVAGLVSAAVTMLIGGAIIGVWRLRAATKPAPLGDEWAS